MSALKNKTWAAFSEYTRLKECIETTGDIEYGICCTCGKTKKFSELDAGHFISRRYTSLLFSEDNVHIQCRYCNRFNQGNGPEYTMYMIHRYGIEHVEKMNTIKHLPKQYKDFELEAIRKFYKDESKKMREGVKRGDIPG